MYRKSASYVESFGGCDRPKLEDAGCENGVDQALGTSRRLYDGCRG